MKSVTVGAVLYAPKVSVIWEIIRGFFEERGFHVDVVHYANYDMQTEALANGQIDIAWSSPLAWLDARRRTGGRCRAIAMRDTDRDRVSHIVVKRGGAVQSIENLRGKTVAVGAHDSPQATLIPLGLLQRRGLEPGRDFQVRRFEIGGGLHGDHVGGERDALQCLQRGEADAAAMIDLNWDAWTADGTVNPGEFQVLDSTDSYDHCVFAVRDDFPQDVEERWLDVLFSMDYDNPDHREMMDLEGLKQWLPARTTGFGALGEAVETQSFFERPAP